MLCAPMCTAACHGRLCCKVITMPWRFDGMDPPSVLRHPVSRLQGAAHQRLG
jgi:hypothetical protein